jgi:hypothetical protein
VIRRAAGVLLLAVLAASGTSACGERETADKDVLAAIRKTELDAREFTYSEVLPGTPTKQSVSIRIDDDFRYKARLSISGQPALDEIAYDDALAVRIVDPSALALLLRKDAVPKSPADADDKVKVVQALSTRRWVVDKVGAPPAIRSTKTKVILGNDPVRDALTVLTYVQRQVEESGRRFVTRFNPDSLEPAYKAKEDPFPRPAKGSGIVRYDLRLAKMPKKADAQGGNQVLPGLANFRKMAIYVRDGRIVEVREDVDVQSRLDDMAKTYDIDFPAGQNVDEQAKFAVDVINAVRDGQGLEPIRFRRMTVKFRALDRSSSIDLPTTDVVEGDLSILRNRGKDAEANATKAPEDIPVNEAAGATVDTTTTTAAPAGDSTGVDTTSPTTTP